MSIEKNIERIADALESVVEQTALLLDAITEPEAQMQDATTLLPKTEEKKEVAVALKKKRASRKKTDAGVTEPPAEAPPAEEPPVEETPKDSEYDQEALKQLGKEVYKKKGAEAVYKVLRDNGSASAKVFDLKPEVYNAVGKKLEEILAGK